MGLRCFKNYSIFEMNSLFQKFSTLQRIQKMEYFSMLDFSSDFLAGTLFKITWDEQAGTRRIA